MSFLKRYSLLIVTFIISLFGIIMIYSASSIWASYKYNDSFKFARMQFIFFIIGLLLIFILSKIIIYIKNTPTRYF